MTELLLACLMKLATRGDASNTQLYPNDLVPWLTAAAHMLKRRELLSAPTQIMSLNIYFENKEQGSLSARKTESLADRVKLYNGPEWNTLKTTDLVKEERI